MTFKALSRSFSRDRRGVAAIEYVVLSSAVAMAIVGAVKISGVGVSNKFDSLASSTGSGTTVTATPVVVARPVAIETPIAVMRPIARPIMMPVAISAD